MKANSFDLKRALLALAAFTLLMLLTTGCDDQPTEVEDYEPEPVLTAFLEATEAVEEVFLERVGDYDVAYQAADYGLDNAEIRLFPVIDAQGQPVDTAGMDTVLTFRDDPSRLGRYLPDRAYHAVPNVRYRIEVTRAADATFGEVNLWAETTVPDTFTLEVFQGDFNTPYPDVDGDTLRRTDEEILIRWTSAFDNVAYGSARQGGYQLGLQALTPKDQLVPLDPDWDPNDPDDEIEDGDKVRWNWTFTPDYQRQTTVAWIYFTWEGWHREVIQACSVEYYNYLFSALLTDDPNSSDNPEFNVQGGLGIFGAYSRQEFNVYVQRVAPLP